MGVYYLPILYIRNPSGHQCAFSLINQTKSVSCSGFLPGHVEKFVAKSVHVAIIQSSAKGHLLYLVSSTYYVGGTCRGEV